jgi:hypothetical protein
LAVGTHLVWGKFNHTSPGAANPAANNKKGGATVMAQLGSQASWQQACVFLRTSRELMPVLHLLKDKYGEVAYHESSLLAKGSKKKDSPSFTIPKNPAKKHPVSCLVKRFGVSQNSGGGGKEATENLAVCGEAYKMLPVIDYTRDLFSRKPSNSHIEQLKHSLARVEHDEQQAAKSWWHMRRRKLGYAAPNALRMRDEQALGPVVFQEVPQQKPSVHEQELCPLIRAPGLDRAHLMERLVRCGIVDEATKDTAAGLECWLVPESA